MNTIAGEYDDSRNKRAQLIIDHYGGTQKIAAIKAVREVFGLSLKGAKRLVDEYYMLGRITFPKSEVKALEDIVIVWEVVPEKTEVYHLIVDVNTGEKIKAAHMGFVNMANCPNEHNADWLQGYLEDKEPLVDEHSTMPLTIPGPCTVVLSGFIL